MNAFDRLHLTIREAIWRQKWAALRPLQIDSIHAILDNSSHLILSAATASGKTEAAFLPILSMIAEEPSGSVQALYISPLKALINDQFRRLENLCDLAQIPVHRWHGDVPASEKRKLKASPAGVLLITPESLESQFINHGAYLQKLYHRLQFVVIDELHSFLEDVRGIHLKSLLCRLKHSSGSDPRYVGLSATLGDSSPACQYLSPSQPDQVRVLIDESEGKETRVGLKAFIRPERGSTEEDEWDSAERQIGEDIAARFRKNTNLVFCNSRGIAEHLVDLLNTKALDEAWAGNPFRVHHGSLSRELREEAEAELKGASDITVLCTRTLEMGIDVGSVRAVGQVGVPWSCASLIQRLGRSGRRDGEPQILRMYSIDDELTMASSPSQRLFPNLLRAIAMVNLIRRKWVECPALNRFHYSTCVHQVLSVLRQTGGSKGTCLFDILCASGAFRNISKNNFIVLLKGMAERNLIQQIETGEIILAPAGEKIVEARDFYAAFATSEEYSIEFGSEKIGLLPVDLVPPPGEHLILGGRRWVVLYLDHPSNVVQVEPSKGRRLPAFLGAPGELAREVMEEMRRELISAETPNFLHAVALELLHSARKYYNESGLSDCDVFVGEHEIIWFPWAGTKIHRTIAACGKASDLAVIESKDGLALHYAASKEQFLRHLEEIVGEKYAHEQVAAQVGNVSVERFDEIVPGCLMAEAFGKERLDMLGAAKKASRLYEIIVRDSR